MNKGGPGGGGPTAAAAAAAAQKQKTLLQRVEGDIANIVDNFSHLVNVARVCVYCIPSFSVIAILTVFSSESKYEH
jgi:hypothetical protein